MGSENKKKDSSVDEAYLMSVMAEGTRAKAIDTEKEPELIKSKPVRNERTKQRKASNLVYEERFLSSHSMTKRGDKSIYIRPEYHERLSRIVQLIGDDKIPLYAYLDNILEYHFEEFGPDIVAFFNNKFKPIL